MVIKNIFLKSGMPFIHLLFYLFYKERRSAGILTAINPQETYKP
jgi:hypothetical protein